MKGDEGERTKKRNVPVCTCMYSVSACANKALHAYMLVADIAMLADSASTCNTNNRLSSEGYC